MFGVYPFGAPYFGQAPNIDANALEHLDAGDACLRVLDARQTMRELPDRMTVRTLRPRATIKETKEC